MLPHLLLCVLGASVAPYDGGADPTSVTTMHIIWSNHFDAGFDDKSWGLQPPQGGSPFAYKTLQNYFDNYIPAGIAMAMAHREHAKTGKASLFQNYSWMTQEWVLSLMLDCEDSSVRSWSETGLDLPPNPTELLRCPNATAIKAVKDAVKRGDVWFHAFPHNPTYGLYDRSLLEAGFASVRRTADRIGIPHPRTVSLRDVPGVTRAIVPLLVSNGIDFVSVGSGGPKQGHPEVPDLFVWRDVSTNTSVLFAHDDGYGGGVHIAPNGHALYCAWNRDNSGPIPTPEATAAQLKKMYPYAKLVSSTFDAYYTAIKPVLSELPVVTQEVGDTWSYGAASDPLKLQVFREISRQRAACIKSRQCNETAPDFQRFDRLLGKVVEHTSGCDVQCYYGDNLNWTNAQFSAALADRTTVGVVGGGVRLHNYQTAIDSWLEQRSYMPNALAALATEPHKQFAASVMDAVNVLRQPQPPSPNAAESRWTPVRRPVAVDADADSSITIHCGGGLAIDFSATDGSVLKVIRRENATSSASRDTEIAGTETTLWAGSMGAFMYQTVGTDDYKDYGRMYGPNFTACDVPYVPPENNTCQLRVTYCGGSSFVKVNVSHAIPERRDVKATLASVWERHDGDACSVLVKTTLPNQLHTVAGAPTEVWSEWNVDHSSLAPSSAAASAAAAAPPYAATALRLQMTWLNKAATKLPEAGWVLFNPAEASLAEPSGDGFTLETEKLSTFLDAIDVVPRGSVNLFSADGMRCNSTSDDGTVRSITARSVDAPFVGIGTPWPFPTRDSSRVEGAPAFQFNLFNNIWGTNYPQWYPFVDTVEAPGKFLDGVNGTFRFQIEIAGGAAARGSEDTALHF